MVSLFTSSQHHESDSGAKIYPQKTLILQFIPKTIQGAITSRLVVLDILNQKHKIKLVILLTIVNILLIVNNS